MSELERKDAEFHRKLGVFLQEVAQLAQVEWLGPLVEKVYGDVGENYTRVGHDLNHEGENVYAKAVYLFNEPFLPEHVRSLLSDLEAVQREGLALRGVSKTRSLLLPHVFEQIKRVKVRLQISSPDNVLMPETVAEEIEAHLKVVKANAASHERVALDDQTRKLYREVAALEKGLERVKAFQDKVLLRYPVYRSFARVYWHGERPSAWTYVRQVGLVAAGSGVRFDHDDYDLEPRSDKVTRNDLEPLAVYGRRVVYSQKAFREAAEKKSRSACRSL